MTATALRSRAMGILAAASFGALWAAAGLSAYRGSFTTFGFLAAFLILGALFAAAVQLMRMARQPGLPVTPSIDRRRMRRRFVVVFIAEIVAINIAAWWLSPQHTAYLMPVVAIIVGLHFCPLAPLFRAPHYYAVAAVMSLAGVIGIAAIALGSNGTACNALVDAICALALWGGCFVSWRSAHRALSSATTFA
ncbi:hypothetical protein [Rhodanobacter sp. DHG33]|uniref:hypothetical protein n=1 Tax=Rhodanobacter sp. DHG33 TaxID=2775921 RepID=UPI0017836E1B|nr:hypothetical protein [Rhodanobacter sp. DHG33]MBD8899712.1 hypothetical protein [Rhodanobacter sp. DHG33]